MLWPHQCGIPHFNALRGIQVKLTALIKSNLMTRKLGKPDIWKVRGMKGRELFFPIQNIVFSYS